MLLHAMLNVAGFRETVMDNLTAVDVRSLMQALMLPMTKREINLYLHPILNRPTIMGLADLAAHSGYRPVVAYKDAGGTANQRMTTVILLFVPVRPILLRDLETIVNTLNDARQVVGVLSHSVETISKRGGFKCIRYGTVDQNVNMIIVHLPLITIENIYNAVENSIEGRGAAVDYGKIVFNVDFSIDFFMTRSPGPTKTYVTRAIDLTKYGWASTRLFISLSRSLIAVDIPAVEGGDMSFVGTDPEEYHWA